MESSTRLACQHAYIYIYVCVCWDRSRQYECTKRMRWESSWSFAVVRRFRFDFILFVDAVGVEFLSGQIHWFAHSFIHSFIRGGRSKVSTKASLIVKIPNKIILKMISTSCSCFQMRSRETDLHFFFPEDISRARVCAKTSRRRLPTGVFVGVPLCAGKVLIQKPKEIFYEREKTEKSEGSFSSFLHTSLKRKPRSSPVPSQSVGPKYQPNLR